jgi:hypothetical protein
MKPSDIIGGLTVFPRFPLSGSCHNSILVAALLHQPIIPVGHHRDLADGHQILADLAKFINSLGTVHWADMKRISRSHYARKFDGRILQLRMFTRRIEVSVPDGTNEIWLEQPWLKGVESMPLAWKRLSGSTEWMPHRPDELIRVLPGQKIEIVSEPPRLAFDDTKNVRNFRLWPVVRRQITEARDRMAPLLRRVTASSIKPS